MSDTIDRIPQPRTPETFPEHARVMLVQQMKLREGQPVAIDATYPIVDVIGVAEELGIKGATAIARIRAGGTDFFVLDTRGSTQYNAPFLIIDGEYHRSKNTGYKGVYSGEELVIGRSHYADRFPVDPKLSRDHFSVLYDGEVDALFITDMGSMNGTRLTAYIPDNRKGAVRGIEDRMTSSVVDSFEHARNYGEKSTEAPYGYYHNHAIIGRKSRAVSDGVYGVIGSEFVIVDDKSKLLRETVVAFLDSLPSTQDAETLSIEGILRAVGERVAAILHYDLESVNKLSSPHYGINGLIDLSEYVEQGVGVCRHQALLAALMIEAAIRTGYLEGQVGVERNHDIELHSAHAWAVYKSESSSDVIVDPAQNFVGTRKQAKDRGLWRYEVANDDE